MVEAKRIDDKNGLIVQLSQSSFWGTDQDYEYRNKVVAAFDRLFQQHNCGVFDGTDIGEGKTNLFIYEIADQDFDKAVSLVLAELDRQKMLDTAIVARTLAVGDPDGPWAEHTVVWPKNLQEEFRV
jgi:hypothetical protein